MNDLFDGLGVQVKELTREKFLRVRETLTRVGMFEEPNIVFQHVFVLHRQGCYAILHSSELKWLDGKEVEPTVEDIAFRNTVTYLLSRWGLVTIEDGEDIESPRCPIGKIIIVPYKQKAEYQLVPSYLIGKKK